MAFAFSTRDGHQNQNCLDSNQVIEIQNRIGCIFQISLEFDFTQTMSKLSLLIILYQSLLVFSSTGLKGVFDFSNKLVKSYLLIR